MVDEGVYKFNPIIFSAIFIAFVFYTGLFSIKEDDDSFVSLVKLTDVNIIEGIVSGSPVKTHKGNNYLVNIVPSKVISKNGIQSSCKGKIPVLLKASAVEAYFPDKLFSKITSSMTFTHSSVRFFISLPQNRITIHPSNNNLFFPMKRTRNVYKCPPR